LQPRRPSPRIAALVVAAGRGTRATEPGIDLPKQYRKLGGRSVIARTLDVFLGLPEVTVVVAVVHPDDRDLYETATAGIPAGRLLPPVAGGASRQQSVHLGLEALADDPPDLVLIHDAVRPFASAGTVRRTLLALGGNAAACAGYPVVDTLQRTGADGTVVETVPREGLWRAATPQAFRYDAILDAHRRAAAAGRSDFTDDVAVAAFAGLATVMIPADEGNMKLTTPADFEAAERRLRADDYLRLADVRVGTGYDVHALEPGDAVTLGGIEIAHDAKLRGHSDADVALHALTDAILGAIGDGDIGQHFPPSDMRWRGMASRVFLDDAVRRVTVRGGIVAHLDVTIIAEAPKIGPHREEIRMKIAEICGISVDRVAVKATTNEGLGFAGRREGIAAIATATVRLPPSV
jgi:2-C-methyl-D-erythritol 4-phosphate cytidylyltransferase/2-C-methyl-D-erythritol 2,4-cyclodiphosphate synthase